MLHAIREAQSALAAIVSPELRPTPRGESLERFLARLPDRWREEQEHAAGKPRARAPHTWRTRPDPFEGVWCDVLGWLQEDPDASAVALLGRLQEAKTDRFSRAHLCNLQRRVRQWRGIMASKLGYAASETTLTDHDGMLGIALSVDDPRGLAGKPLAGFCTTPSRRITVVYGVIVYAIRFKTPSLHR